MQQFLHAESDQDICGCECKMEWGHASNTEVQYSLATKEYHPNMNIWCEGRPLWHQSTFKS